MAIIGASGFIGLALSEALSKAGYDIFGIIRNNKTPYYKIYNKLNIKTIFAGDLEKQK